MKKGYLFLSLTFISSFFFGLGYGNEINAGNNDEVFRINNSEVEFFKTNDDIINQEVSVI